MRKLHFFFDIGGVLVNWSPERMAADVAAQAGRSAGDILRAFAPDILYPVETGRVSSRDFYMQYVKNLVPAWSYNDWVGVWMDNYSLNAEGVGLFHELIGNGYRVYMLSNLAEYNKQALERKFPDFFKWSCENFLSFQMGCWKPEREIYLRACEGAGTRPAESVFLDDMPENVEGAVRAGMRGILVKPGDFLHVRAQVREIISG